MRTDGTKTIPITKQNQSYTVIHTPPRHIISATGQPGETKRLTGTTGRRSVFPRQRAGKTGRRL